MSEFAKAKVKREHFVSHNEKAVKLVEDLLNSKNSNSRIKESLDSINTALVEIENDEQESSLLNLLVLRLAHSRDNNLIEKFLQRLEGSEYRTQAFHALVLKLTCNNDWHTLDTVLRYGKDIKLEPVSAGCNPIILASEQVIVKPILCGNNCNHFRDTCNAPRNCMVLDTGSQDQSRTKNRTRTSQIELDKFKRRSCWGI